MKYVLSLLLALCLSFSSLAKSNEIGDNIDITHYEIHLNDINFTDKTLDAVTTVALTTKNATDIINLELKSLTVSEIISEEVNISDFSQEGDVLSINFSNTIPENTNISLTISYSGNTFNESWGGIHWNGEYVYNLGVGFESQPHNLGKTWFPCVDNFIDKASYDLYITIPEALNSSCGGLLTETIINNDGTKTMHWSMAQDIPTYLMSFAIGDYVLWEETYNGIEKDIPINVYVKPNQIDKVEATFANIKEIAAFFEDKFGAYPFNRIGFVSTSLGCMEHIDNIAMSSSLFTGTTNLDSEYYIAHELSHMWFGNKTTCSTAGDMWLNEGFATFCGAYYLTELYGENYYSDYMNSLINSITVSCHLSEGWIPLNNMPLDITYGTTVYDKGAIVVHSLMNYLGRDTFNDAIKYYLNKYEYSSASSEDLRDALTEFTGVDMNGFFDSWVFTPGSPNYSIRSFTTEPNADKFDVQVNMRQKHRGSEHIGENVIYDIAFIDENWNIYTDTICWDGETGISTKTIDFEPIATFCDYNNKFADACSANTFIIKERGDYNFGIAKFKAMAEEVSDSTLLHIEHHWVGAETVGNIPAGMRLSSERYWTVHRLDKGRSIINAEFQYQRNSSYDEQLITSESDSTLLLYRSDATQEWQTIDYEFQGFWNFGRMVVSNIQSGDYTLAVFDKNQIGLNEIEENDNYFKISPNPTKDVINIHFEKETNGKILIINQLGQIIKEVHVNGIDSSINIEDISSGAYNICITNNNRTIQSKRVVIE